MTMTLSAFYVASHEQTCDRVAGRWQQWTGNTVVPYHVSGSSWEALTEVRLAYPAKPLLFPFFSLYVYPAQQNNYYFILCADRANVASVASINHTALHNIALNQCQVVPATTVSAVEAT